MERIELKALSKGQIKGKIGILFLVTLINYGITAIASSLSIVGSLLNAIFLTPSLSLGIIMVYLKLINEQSFKAGDIFEGFYDWWSAFKVTFLEGLFIFLWSLLLIVPGIIKSYSYAMAIYILAENKGMSALEAINKSKKMMDGHKMDLFVLQLSFLGWALLVIVTLGIAAIWVAPYMHATYANFYKSLKPNDVIDVEYTNIEE